jgi:hypothetical protein
MRTQRCCMLFPLLLPYMHRSFVCVSVCAVRGPLSRRRRHTYTHTRVHDVPPMLICHLPAGNIHSLLVADRCTLGFPLISADGGVSPWAQGYGERPASCKFHQRSLVEAHWSSTVASSRAPCNFPGVVKSLRIAYQYNSSRVSFAS